MAIVILGLGLVCAIAGGAMIGMGIPIKEFGLGNTLIMAGITSVVGGFLLLGLAGAIRLLQRIAKAMETRTAIGAGTAAETSIPCEARIEIEPLPQGGGGPRDESKGTSADVAVDRKVEVPARPNPTEAAGTSQSQSRIERVLLEAHRTAANQDVPASDRLRSFAGERTTGERTDKDLKGEKVEGLPRSAAPHAATILKAGVIDGMGYTLYTDGSIEAELPQGTLRFGSIDELRRYLASS